jgi:hypothetical protein
MKQTISAVITGAKPSRDGAGDGSLVAADDGIGGAEPAFNAATYPGAS